MRKTTALWMLPLAVLLPRCAGAAQARPLCKVVERAGRFDGKTVTVKAVYWHALEHSVLWCPCGSGPGNQVWVKFEPLTSMQRSAAAVLNRSAGQVYAAVVFRGKFRRASGLGSGHLNEYRYQLERTRVISATLLVESDKLIGEPIPVPMDACKE